jgi:hypothetical protein
LDLLIARADDIMAGLIMEIHYTTRQIILELLFLLLPVNLHVRHGYRPGQ